MRYRLTKYVDAETAKEAIALDKKTPVHECYLKDGEEPKLPSGGNCHAVGFRFVDGGFGEEGEPFGRRARRK